MARFGLRPRLEDDVPLARAARDAGVPIRTARRWRARFRQNGVELAVPHGVGRTASRL